MVTPFIHRVYNKTRDIGEITFYREIWISSFLTA